MKKYSYSFISLIRVNNYIRILGSKGEEGMYIGKFYLSHIKNSIFY